MEKPAAPELPADFAGRRSARLSPVFVVRFASWSALGAAAILILMAPAVWNGFPLLEWDTGGYLARWFEGYLVPSRPGAYALFLLAGIPLDFWPNILIQSALTIWVLFCVFRAFDVRGQPLALFLCIVLLSLTTTLPWLTSVLLTDVFAGLSVLAIYLLIVKAEAFGRVTRWSLVAFVAFSAATHSATFGLLAVLAALACVLHALGRPEYPRAGVRRAVFAVLLGAALTLAGNFAVSGRVAWTPGGYGILFGRMLQDGLVKRYLDDRCPDTRLRLCPYRNRLPKTADEFLWSGGIFNDLGRFAGLGDEMRTIVLGSLVRYPVLQAKAAISATAAQLFSVKSGEGVLASVWHTYIIIENYTPGALPAMRAARQQHGELSFDLINRIHVPIALICMASLPIITFVGRKRQRLRDIQCLALTASAALLANAAICGVLSNPHDRYGARLAWIAPLTVILALAGWLTSPRAVTDG